MGRDDRWSAVTEGVCPMLLASCAAVGLIRRQVRATGDRPKLLSQPTTS